MNDFRRDLVERAFIILDKTNEGVIDERNLKSLYNAKMHPDVLQGKRGEQSVLLEFLDSWKVHSSINCNLDGKITLD